MQRILGIDFSDLEIEVKVKGQIMYFLVNAYPPKPLKVATTHFAGA